MKQLIQVFCLIMAILLLRQPVEAQTIPSFTNITGSAGIAAGNDEGTAFGDIDNDGNLDIYDTTTNSAASDFLFRNLGDLTFQDIRASAGIQGEQHLYVSFHDFNNDGFVDILISGHPEVQFVARLYKNLGNNTFVDVAPSALPTTDLGYDVCVADLNQDGWVDIISSRYFFLNNGDETFTSSNLTGVSFGVNEPLKPYVADTDNDGDLDLIMIEVNEQFTLYENQGNLTFTDITVSSGLPTGVLLYHDVDFGDIDNDGDLDLYLGMKGLNFLFRNDGNHQFTDISAASGTRGTGLNTRSSGFGDINNDGFLDIYLSNFKSANKMFLNNGNNTFADITTQTNTGNGGAGHGIAFGDINNDGNLDLHVVNSEFQSSPLYLNNGTNNNWVGVKLIGTVSNTAAMGAKIHLVTGSSTLLREVGRGATLGCQNITPVHFGIGNASNIDYLEVDWPSGIVQRINNPQINQILTIIEREPNQPPNCSGAAIVDQSANANCQTTISAADVTGVTDPDGDPLTITVSPSILVLGANTVTVTADDGKGGMCSADITVNVVDDIGPVITCPADITVSSDAGGCTAVVNFNVTATDNCSIASIVSTPASGSAFPLGTTTVTSVATDGAGNTAVCTFDVKVTDGESPVITSVTGPVNPQQAGSTVNASGDFTDACDSDDHSATWDWGDGIITSGTVDQLANLVTSSHPYDSAGVYTITLTVTDGAGNSDSAIFEFVVIYDPNSGFVTGGGWIDSPTGAYIPEPSLTGKANFGFVSKYKKGKSTPTGQTQFQFKTASLNFHSGTYEWLVITKHKAMFKGEGTINNAGNYGFQLTAIDADLTPSTNVDLFRIRIWNKDNNDVLVYDNEIGQNDPNANPTTEISGGSIKIHDGKATKIAANANEATEQIPEAYALEQNYPNPFNPSTVISFAVPTASEVTLSIHNLRGQLIDILHSGVISAGRHSMVWNGKDSRGAKVASGVYLYQLRGKNFVATKKLVLTK